MKNVFRVCAFSFFLFSVAAFVAPASAHDGEFDPINFSGIGSGVAVTVDHFEPDNDIPEDHKGWATFTFTHTGTEPWGDMHFCIAGENVSSVDWIVDGIFAPTYKLNGVPKALWGIAVDNSLANATLDLYFYDNPVMPGDVATFSAYTDNTSQMLSFFGICVWPTPVPEPATLAMLSLGGLVLFRKRRA